MEYDTLDQVPYFSSTLKYMASGVVTMALFKPFKSLSTKHCRKKTKHHRTAWQAYLLPGDADWLGKGRGSGT